MNANQLVAYNLGRLRRDEGKTQEEAAAQLEQWRGQRWSKATWSIAERYAFEAASRRREFDANDLLALAAAFKKPIGYFFELPEGVDDIAAGESHEVSRRVGRAELAKLTAPPTDWEAKQHATTLRKVADALEKRSD
jgi:transcriptional regulator with XRE-family HTH domain